MSEGRQYPQIRLVEREKENAKMCELSRAVVNNKTSQILYFQARGGLGKTRLLQEYPRLIQQPPDGQPMELLVADIIDLYDFENWRPIEIERKIVDSLRIAAFNKGISNFDTIFAEYNRQYKFYQSIRGVSHVAIEKAEKTLRSALVASLSELSRVMPIALRFDTLEPILNNRQPDFAFTFDRNRLVKKNIDKEEISENYSPNVGVHIVLKWFNEVIPQLQHYAVFVLMAGRPPWVKQNQDILKQFAPGIEILELSEIKSSDNIAQFLTQSGFALSGDDDLIPYVKRITAGLPLLLRLFARTHRQDNPAGNTYEFEDNLIAQTFNPLTQRTTLPLDASATFVFCMYILACARRGIRRGIRRKALREVFERLGIAPDSDEIDNLADEMLIKTVSYSKLPGTADDTPDEDTILLVHDEIQVLIDQSKKLDELHYRRPILDYLCELAGEEARRSRPVGQSLKPLTDHMYYELTRNIADGYRTYTVYVDLLLRQRAIQDALVLAGVFWNTLYYAVDRGGETDLPFYDRLAESQQITIDDIRRDEAVRYVKRLRYSDDNTEAAAWAERLYQEFSVFLPAEQNWQAINDSHDQYLFADLCLAWANALAQSKTGTRQSQRLLRSLQSWLEQESLRQPLQEADDLPLRRHLLYLRRTFFLGETYNLLAQIHGGQMFFRLAIGDLEKSEKAFTAYKQDKIPIYREDVSAVDATKEQQPTSATSSANENTDSAIPMQSEQENSDTDSSKEEKPSSAATYLNDNVDNEIAQVRNNLAYRYAELGKLDEAITLSQEVFRDFVGEQPVASAYQQALFHNTQALILLRNPDFEEIVEKKIKESLDEARKAAEQSGVDRTLGLVAQASLMYKRAEWNARKHVLTNDELDDFNNEFDFALAKFRQQTLTLSELWHERARFWRDIAEFFKSEGENDQTRDYLREAKKFLDAPLNDLAQLDVLGIRRANLLETQACLDIINGRDTSAKKLLDKAEELLREKPDQEEIPVYAQIVVGKISLQRGRIFLHQNKPQPALREFAIALARSYVFAIQGSRSRYQAAFEALIGRWVRDDVAADELSAFIRAMYTDTEDVPSKASRLSLLRPSAEGWLDAWSKSLKFFADLQQPTATIQANEAGN